MDKNRKLILLVSAAIVLIVIIYWIARPGGGRNEEHGDGLSVPGGEVVEISQLYGIDYSDLMLDEAVIESGHSFSVIGSSYGLSSLMIDKADKAAREVFPLRNMRAGKKYTAFLTTDSIPKLRHFVYDHSVTDFIVISFENDSVMVRKEHKDVVTTRKKASAVITSSLWNSMVDAGMSTNMIKDFENIYQWTIDFFGIQNGDNFTIIYDELSIDGVPIGAGAIWGAVFSHNGKQYYAIPFKQNGKLNYWDEKANSLRKSMLKAPLNYTRISSRFSNSRMHPVLKVRRAHHGVDYAAPSGTPVVAVADGNVSFRGWDSKGGGNVIKIKHARGMETGYLHLRGFAPGITSGKRVGQGDLIGYVGSTGTSTGPHLDYRIWINGKATDPLKITAEPAEPISSAALPDFNLVKERVMGELDGTLPESLRITQLDSISVYRKQATEIKTVPNPQ